MNPPLKKYRITEKGYISLKSGLLYTDEDIKVFGAVSKSIETDSEGNSILVINLASH